MSLCRTPVETADVPEIRTVTLGNPKVGLGITGFAGALVVLGIRYAGEEPAASAEKPASFIQKHAHPASEGPALE